MKLCYPIRVVGCVESVRWRRLSSFFIVAWMMMIFMIHSNRNTNGIVPIVRFVTSTPSNILVHPSPWESVHVMRRRLNITYQYRTHSINPESCRFLTEQECRIRDEKHQSAIEKQYQNRLLRRQQAPYRSQQKQQQQPYHVNTPHREKGMESYHRYDPTRTVSSSFDRTNHRHRQLIPNVGDDIKILVLLVRFRGHETRNLPTVEYFRELFNGNEVTTTNPIGSIRQYLRYASLGVYNGTLVVFLLLLLLLFCLQG
jgi:hypothetical protein